MKESEPCNCIFSNQLRQLTKNHCFYKLFINIIMLCFLLIPISHKIYIRIKPMLKVPYKYIYLLTGHFKINVLYLLKLVHSDLNPSSYPLTPCSPWAANVLPLTFVHTFSINPQPTNPEFQPVLTPGHVMYCHIFYTLAPVPPPSLRGHTPLLYLETPTLLMSWSNAMFSVKSFLTSQPGPHLCFYTKVSITAFSTWSGNYLLTPVFLTSQGEHAERSDQCSFVFMSQNSVQDLLLLSCFSCVRLCATP